MHFWGFSCSETGKDDTTLNAAEHLFSVLAIRSSWDFLVDLEHKFKVGWILPVKWWGFVHERRQFWESQINDFGTSSGLTDQKSSTSIHRSKRNFECVQKTSPRVDSGCVILFTPTQQLVSLSSFIYCCSLKPCLYLPLELNAKWALGGEGLCCPGKQRLPRICTHTHRFGCSSAPPAFPADYISSYRRTLRTLTACYA